MGLIKSQNNNSNLTNTDDQNQATIDTIIKKSDIIVRNRESFIPTLRSKYYSDILRYIEGYKTITTYYHRLLAHPDTSTNQITFDTQDTPYEHSFECIQNLPLYLEDQLNIDTDTDFNETTISGTATCPPGLMPYPGDVIILPVGNNNLGVAVVSDVNRLSLFNETLYTITFYIKDWLNQDIQNTLNQNTYKYWIYDEKYLFTTKKGLFLKEEYEFINTLAKHLETLHAYIKKYSYDPKYKTLMLKLKPDDYYPFYDPYLVEFYHQTIGINESQAIKQYFNVNNLKFQFNNTILGIILDPKGFIPDILREHMYIVRRVPGVFERTDVTSLYGTSIVLVVKSPTEIDSVYWIQNNDFTNYYIFSKEAYKAIKGLTYNETLLDTTEKILIKIINQQPITKEEIETILNEYPYDIYKIIKNKKGNTAIKTYLKSFYYPILHYYFIKLYMLQLGEVGYEL